MSLTEMRKLVNRLIKEVVTPEDVITHYHRVNQLEVRLKNIAILKIEKRRHEKAKQMLRDVINKIIEQQAEFSKQKAEENTDLYQMIVGDIKKLQDSGIKKANSEIDELSKIVNEAEEIKLQLIELAEKKQRLED